jgi:hypothetical protein
MNLLLNHLWSTQIRRPLVFELKMYLEAFFQPKPISQPLSVEFFRQTIPRTLMKMITFENNFQQTSKDSIRARKFRGA